MTQVDLHGNGFLPISGRGSTSGRRTRSTANCYVASSYAGAATSTAFYTASYYFLFVVFLVIIMPGLIELFEALQLKLTSARAGFLVEELPLGNSRFPVTLV